MGSFLSWYFYLQLPFWKNLLIKNIYGYDFLKKNLNDIWISARIDHIKFDIKSSWLNPEKIRKIVWLL